MATHPETAAKVSRYTELEQLLNKRCLELENEVHDLMRDARTDNFKEREVLDEGDSSEADAQEEIGFALLQMKTETLNKIRSALQRLAQGTYGRCLECGSGIHEARLRALPFAVRCKQCEEAFEAAQRFERLMAQRRESAALFQMSR